MEGMGADIQIVRKIYEVGWTRHGEFDIQTDIQKIRELAGKDIGMMINSLLCMTKTLGGENDVFRGHGLWPMVHSMTILRPRTRVSQQRETQVCPLNQND